MKRKCNVIMLPTEKTSSISLGNSGFGFIHHTEQRPYYTKRTYQHLYITSDENINNNNTSDGGWGYNTETKELIDCDANFYNPWVKKVIATTDLIYSCPDCELAWTAAVMCETCQGETPSLPEIPESFIKEYVSNPVEEGMVEYRETDNSFHGGQEEYKLVLDNNQIIITLVEQKMYSRDEVEELIYKATLIDNACFYFDEWINENL